jgi:hypothetical protein
VRSGNPKSARALFEVTSGGVFWIVAVGDAGFLRIHA